jgi:hypothetical protein
MCKAFAFKLSPEVTSDENPIERGSIQFDIAGDGDFGWIGSRNKAKAHRLRDCEVALNRIADRVMLSGVETNSKSFDVFPASLLNLKQVLVRKQLIVAMPKRQGARRRVFCKSF